MDTLNILKNRLDQVTKEFQILIRENRQLKEKLESMQNENDIFTRNSEDLILTIKNKLQQDERKN
ncbi:MAG: hypothetical protein U9R37_06410 [Campylobacterota bacterium]|nr:hypothetical protein [Campylobacterota bacterium]